jgi:FKBP-type peptidyl-prolyl cis-trans isomerase FklB
MKKLVFFAVLCFTAFTGVSFFSCTSQAPQGSLKTDVDSLSYAMGVQSTQGLDEYLQQMGITGATKAEFYKSLLEGAKMDKKDTAAIALIKARGEGQRIGMQISTAMFPNLAQTVFGTDSTKTLNKAQFLAGFIAAAENKKLLIKQEDAQMFVQEKTDQIFAQSHQKEKEENQAFLDDNKKKEGVVTLPSGLQYKVEKEGTGIKPGAEDTVTVNYVGTDIKGVEFDSNTGKAPASFPVNRVIKGWTEGIQLMSQGAKYTLYVPYDLAYGVKGQQPKIGPFATLIFNVELLKVSPKVEKATPAAPAAPKMQIVPKK